MKTIISGTGRAVPNNVITNSAFAQQTFLDEEGNPFAIDSSEIIEKFSSITGIEERRYADKDINSSDLAAEAAKKAIADAGCDPEQIDYIIVAHNFGEFAKGSLEHNEIPPNVFKQFYHALKTQIVWHTIFSLAAQDGLKE